MSAAEREAPTFEEFRDFERRGWNRVAARYASTFGRCTSQAIEPMLDAAGVRSGSHIIDLACGPGFAAAAAMRRGATAAALDFSPEMVALAQINCPGADVREGEAGKLPWQDATFDAVVSNFGVNHFPDVDRAFFEMRRVLKSSGRMAFTVWEPIERSVGQRLLHEAIAAAGRLDVPLPASPSAHRFADETEVKHALGAAGFKDNATRSFDVPLTAPTSRDVFEVFQTGTVRLGEVLHLQSASDLSRIREVFERSLAPWTTPAGVAVPMRLALTSARAA